MTKIVFLSMCWISVQVLAGVAQDTPASMLQLGGKQEKMAVGKKGEERASELLKAVEIYRRLESEWPDATPQVAKARLKTGEILRRLDRLDEGLAAFESALSLEGQILVHAKAGLAAAKIHRKRRDFEKAVAILERVVVECGSETRLAAQASLAQAGDLRRQKEWERAHKSARRVVDDFPDAWRENVDACNMLISLLIHRKQWVNAISGLAELDAFLVERYQDHEKWPSIRRAMDRMSSRKTLTPVGD